MNISFLFIFCLLRKLILAYFSTGFQNKVLKMFRRSSLPVGKIHEIPPKTFNYMKRTNFSLAHDLMKAQKFINKNINNKH